MDPKIPQFNAYSASGGTPPFVFNTNYDINQSNEANTYDQIASEFQYLFGWDVVFIPRELKKEEVIFGEFLSSTFEKGFKLRTYIEENEFWSGQGDIYSKFGLRVTDECKIICNKTTFSQATSGIFPKPGDLFFIERSKKLFEITHIEDEITPGFYFLGNKTHYQFSCRLFNFSHEKISQDLNSGIPESVKALDDLLENVTTSGSMTLPEKEEINNNKQIQRVSIDNSIIDKQERDPLFD